MLQILTFAALLCGSLAAITDINCTTLVGADRKYSPDAVNCANKYPDADCTALFGGPVAVNTDAERPDKCFKNAVPAVDEAIKQLAISLCPKTCGYCCQTPPYNCENKPFPRITCAAITQDMCLSPLWKDIITEDCPKTCGFCDQGNCVDLASGCARDMSICRNVDMQQFVKENCKRTCGFCSQNGGSTADCGNDPKCVSWVQNGFCNSPYYTPEQKKQYCGKMCNLC